MDIIVAIQPPTQDIYPAAATHVLIRTGSLGVPPTFFYQLQKRTGVAPDEVVLPLTDGNVSMTTNQWDSWRDDMTDEEYITRKILNRLDLVRL